MWLAAAYPQYEDEQQSKTKHILIIFISIMENDNLTAKQRRCEELKWTGNKGEEVTELTKEMGVSRRRKKGNSWNNWNTWAREEKLAQCCFAAHFIDTLHLPSEHQPANFPPNSGTALHCGRKKT